MSLLHRRRTDSWTVMSIRNCAIAFCIISVIWVESGQPFVLGGVFKKLADNIVTLSNEELMHALPEDANEHVLLIEFQSRLMDIWRSIEAIKVLQSEKSVLDAEENVPEQISKFERFIQRADFREALERDCLTDGTSIVHVYDQYRRLILSLRSFLKHNALQRLLALADVEFNGSPTSDSFEKYRKCVNAVVYYLESKEFQSPYKDQLPISDMVKTNNANVELAKQALEHAEKIEKLTSDKNIALDEFRDSESKKSLEKYNKCVDALAKCVEKNVFLRFPMSEEEQSKLAQDFKTYAEDVRKSADAALNEVKLQHDLNAKKREKMKKLTSDVNVALAEFRDSGSNKSLEKHKKCVDALVKFLESDALFFPGLSEEQKSMLAQKYKTKVEGVRKAHDAALIKVKLHHDLNAKKREKMKKLTSDVNVALAEFRDSGSNKSLEKHKKCVDALVKFLESDALFFPGLSEEQKSMLAQKYKTKVEGVRKAHDAELIKVQRRHYQNAKKRDLPSAIGGFIVTVCILLAILCVYRVCAKSEQLLPT
eukprot:301460_1